MKPKWESGTRTVLCWLHLRGVSTQSAGSAVSGTKRQAAHEEHDHSEGQPQDTEHWWANDCVPLDSLPVALLNHNKKKNYTKQTFCPLSILVEEQKYSTINQSICT